MSDQDPLDGDDPLGGIPFLGDLMRMLGSQPGAGWDGAKQLAVSVATEGVSEPNVDPLARIAFEQLARVAELHVAEATSLDVAPVRIEAVTRADWSYRTLDAYRPLMQTLSASLGAQPSPDQPADPAMALFGNLMAMMGPMMLSMTAGSMVGHLARRSLGVYDLPLPRPDADPLLVVPANVDEFADEWSLPPDDLRLWICLHEVIHHAVLGVDHVRARLVSLLDDYASSFESNPDALGARFGELDMSGDMQEAAQQLQHVLGDPEVILGAVQSDHQRAILPELTALVAVIGGYVDEIMDRIGAPLIGSYQMLTEAVRRRRVEADQSDRFVEKLLGLELTQDQYDRGSAFIAGVVERAGDEAVSRLWSLERNLPTPAEVDAPGLWLARIDLPD